MDRANPGTTNPWTAPADHRPYLVPQAGHKPKLVFFQLRYSSQLPPFLLIHKREHVDCLSHFFDVTVIDHDCDFQQICDAYEPDLTLFESGVPNPACEHLKISNVRSCSRIPKLGLLHSDGFCCARAGFLSDMDHWGIETFFAIATSAPEHLPELAGRLFIWPNSIDPAVFRDYGQYKCVPVLFTGNTNALYPWRQQIMKVLASQYACLICPHPGYGARRSPSRVAVGEPYARTLNSSWFVPACGTIAREIVRKHFEIPGSRACLITQRSRALEAAGFVDMVNCLFADENTVVDKVNYLTRNSEALDRIITNGYELVHCQHTQRQRSQVLQWFQLQKKVGPTQAIVQDALFGELSIKETSAHEPSAVFVSGGDHLACIREGDRHLGRRHYEQAEALYRKALQYIPYMPEPNVRLCICSLYQGQPKKALSWIREPLQFTLGEYRAADPDPVEWAYLILTQLCMGDVRQAAKRSAEFWWLHHPTLDYARHVSRLAAYGGQMTLPVTGASMIRRSIHSLKINGFEDLTQHVSDLLSACGQGSLSRQLKAEGLARHTSRSKVVTQRPSCLDRLPVTASTYQRTASTGRFRRQVAYKRLFRAVRTTLRNVLHDLEARFRYFLPYYISAARNDEFYRTIKQLAREGDLANVLLVGTYPGQRCIDALMAGARDGCTCRRVLCIVDSASGAATRVGNERRQAEGEPAIELHCVNGSLDLCLDEFKLTRDIDQFDAVFVDGTHISPAIASATSVQDEVARARFVVLDAVTKSPNDEIHCRLLRNMNFVLLQQNLGLRKGYSIFRRMECEHATITSVHQADYAL